MWHYNIVNFPVFANCCVWNYIPFEIHGLQKNLCIRNFRLPHFGPIFVYIKYTFKMATCYDNDVTAPHVYEFYAMVLKASKVNGLQFYGNSIHLSQRWVIVVFTCTGWLTLKYSTRQNEISWQPGENFIRNFSTYMGQILLQKIYFSFIHIYCIIHILCHILILRGVIKSNL